MEHCAVIRFLSFKGLKAQNIQIELEQVYEAGALEIGAVKTDDAVSCRGESTLKITHGPEDRSGRLF
jgi:hypothetical protein